MKIVRHEILIVSSLATIALALVISAESCEKQGVAGRPVVLLTGPLRLTANSTETIHEFLLGLRVYHYRARLQGQQTISEYIYDTADWRLHDQSASLLLRVEIKASGKREYDVRLRAMDNRDESSLPIELLRAKPASLSEDLISSQWDLQLVRKFGFVPEQLQKALYEFGVSVDELALQLQGSLIRDRFQVTDKGRTWFEIDHERWFYRRPSARNGFGELEINDLVIKLREHEGAADLVRRAKTMEEFALSMYPLAIPQHSPRERAISTFR